MGSFRVSCSFTAESLWILHEQPRQRAQLRFLTTLSFSPTSCSDFMTSLETLHIRYHHVFYFYFYAFYFVHYFFRRVLLLLFSSFLYIFSSIVCVSQGMRLSTTTVHRRRSKASARVMCEYEILTTITGTACMLGVRRWMNMIKKKRRRENEAKFST